MSGTATGGRGGSAHARVTARFDLRADGGEDAAAAAADLIHSLQELVSLPQCACDLDVGVEWPGGPGEGEDAPPR